MKYEEKYLKYKNRIVFGKQSMQYFDRLPKEYSEDEACFVFVNEALLSGVFYGRKVNVLTGPIMAKALFIQI